MPLERLSTRNSIRNQPPSTIALAIRGSRRPRGGAGHRSAPCCSSGAPRSSSTSRASASSPNRANGSIHAAWSPRPLPNSRSGPGAGPNGIGFASRPVRRHTGGAPGPQGRAPAAAGCGSSPVSWWDSSTFAPARTGTCPGPPSWPSTRPTPLYSNVRPSSVLFVELPTYGRWEAGVSSTNAIHENATTQHQRAREQPAAPMRRAGGRGAHSR